MAFKKILFVILDGLGDRPIKNLEGKTPLEAARTPNMDFFAQNGICGVQNALPKGVYPTSEECHLALFGYHYIKDYPGRGVLEALGLGIKLNPGDLALRVDFGTVDEDLRVVDPRAGNISRTIEFSEAIGTREVDGFNFEIYSGLAHRGVLIISGKDLSENVHAHSS
ncbi:MAG: putative 2,3-bisphosphoglycerate-independent phosphoglycerate mutase 1, partial [candidate division CPR2 bacterium GW2011_GWD2_39_7]